MYLCQDCKEHSLSKGRGEGPQQAKTKRERSGDMGEQAVLFQEQVPMESIPTMLIVERNPAILDWLMNTIYYSKMSSSQKKYRGVGFSSMVDALLWIEQARAFHRVPNIVLLDCSIPTKETYELLNTISACQTSSPTDIILLAMTTQRTPPPGREWEKRPLLYKPFRPRELFDTISSLLKKGEERSQH